MGAVAPLGDHDTAEAPGIGDLLNAVSGMFGGIDPGAILGAISSQATPDNDLADQVAALTAAVDALRADLAPILEAFGTLMQVPKVRRALQRVDV